MVEQEQFKVTVFKEVPFIVEGAFEVESIVIGEEVAQTDFPDRYPKANLKFG